MSKEQEITFEEFAKSMADLEFSEEELKSMWNKNSIEKGEEEEKKEEDEESYEDMEKSLNKMKADMEAYEEKMKAKKPVTKSEEEDIFKAELGEIEKSFGEKVEAYKEEIEKSFSDKFDEMSDMIKSLQEDLEKMGNETPIAKSSGINYGAIIEKAQHGIEEDGVKVMSQKVNKADLLKSLEECWEETSGKEIQKSFENSIYNLSNMGEITKEAKGYLETKKGIKVI